MLDFLSSISDAISTAISFLFGIVTNLFSVLSLLGSATSFLFECVSLLPPALVIFCTLGITIAIVFLIIGR